MPLDQTAHSHPSSILHPPSSLLHPPYSPRSPQTDTLPMLMLAPEPTAVRSPDAAFHVQTEGLLHPWVRREWLLTNGIGGFASSTVVGCNIRRYHGLLVAATLPPVGRVMLLNRIGEILKVD